MMKNESCEIVSPVIEKLYPLIFLFGIYIILNGHKTPGGGFQGGAVLTSIFITRYISAGMDDINIDVFKIIEKYLFVLIVTLPVLYIFSGFAAKLRGYDEVYLILMNIAIGIKVWSGLSIIFFRFMFYEAFQETD